MSDSPPPLADISIVEAEQMRGALLRAIASGSLVVRYTDGTSITYRSLAEMRAALVELEGRIAAASAILRGQAPVAPLRGYVMRPWNGFY